MNTIRSILYATDFSAHSEKAFSQAVALARDYEAKLIIAHVGPPPFTAYTPGSLAVIYPEGSPEEIRERLTQFDPKDSRVHIEYLVGVGVPAVEIVRMAHESHCDLIVIGTHGRTGLSRIVLGSVAEQILRHAPCPVLTIRCPNDAEPEPNRVRTEPATDVVAGQVFSVP